MTDGNAPVARGYPTSVTVPREPTREMWAAMADAVYGMTSVHHDRVVAAVYNAMLQSAPQPLGVAQCSLDHIEIKRLSGLLADAQRIIAEYKAGTTAEAKADVAAHGLPGARVQRADTTQSVISTEDRDV